MLDEFTCEMRIRFRGKDLHLNQIVGRLELEDVLPPRGPVDPFDMVRVSQAAERRQRLVDYISSQIAHGLTEAIFKDVR